MDARARTPLEQHQHPQRLKGGQIGPFGLAALSLGAVSPALALFALWGPMQTATGPITPLIYIGAAVLVLPTAISYAMMNRELPAAGAASTWLWRTVSPAAGYLVGLTMLTYFVMVVVAMPLQFAIFFRDLLAYFGLPDYGLATLLLAIPVVSLPVMWAAYRGAQTSTRAAVVLMTIESAVVIALAWTVLHAKVGVPDAINSMPFDPSAATHGFAGFWAAILIGVLSYLGFDVVSTAAEETNAPREHVPKAIVITIVLVTIFWAVMAWAFTLGISHERVIQYSAQGQSAVTPMAQSYWGRGSILIILTAFSGNYAVYITMALGTSRIVFAMARHGLLPRFLSQLDGPKRVPTRALNTVFAVAVLGSAVSLLALRNAVTAFTWWANAMVFFAIFTFAAVNLANLIYFRRFARERFRLWANGIVPVIGIAVTIYVLYEAFFVTLWNADFTTGRSVVICSVALFCVFLLCVWRVAVKLPERLRGEPPIEAEAAPAKNLAE